jgi:hypothetical protein
MKKQQGVITERLNAAPRYGMIEVSIQKIHKKL